MTLAPTGGLTERCLGGKATTASQTRSLTSLTGYWATVSSAGSAGSSCRPVEGKETPTMAKVDLTRILREQLEAARKGR